jgi:putative endonuclease
MEAYMYILKCGEGKFYVGSTKNLKRRIEEHQLGIGANFTKKNRPISLVYFETFPRIDLAFEREHQLKKWSQAKKLALINGNKELLKKLSKGS